MSAGDVISADLACEDKEDNRMPAAQKRKSDAILQDLSLSRPIIGDNRSVEPWYDTYSVGKAGAAWA